LFSINVQGFDIKTKIKSLLNFYRIEIILFLMVPLKNMEAGTCKEALLAEYALHFRVLATLTRVGGPVHILHVEEGHVQPAEHQAVPRLFFPP
jgi:hypothetical protein